MMRKLQAMSQEERKKYRTVEGVALHQEKLGWSDPAFRYWLLIHAQELLVASDLCQKQEHPQQPKAFLVPLAGQPISEKPTQQEILELFLNLSKSSQFIPLTTQKHRELIFRQPELLDKSQLVGSGRYFTIYITAGSFQLREMSIGLIDFDEKTHYELSIDPGRNFQSFAEHNLLYRSMILRPNDRVSIEDQSSGRPSYGVFKSWWIETDLETQLKYHDYQKVIVITDDGKEKKILASQVRLVDEHQEQARIMEMLNAGRTAKYNDLIRE